jgi:hypothetical protein
MLSRLKRRTLHLTGFSFTCCFIVDKTRSHNTRSHNTKNVAQFLLCFRFLLFACFVFHLSFWVFLGIVLAFDRKSILVIWNICLFCFRDMRYISLEIQWQISRITIYPIQGSVVGGYSTYFVTKDTTSLSKYKTTIFTDLAKCCSFILTISIKSAL